ncbi:serine hydrolase domain-containing protein [Polaribacter ponticola]|uniref:Serine hydrolase n=1 Tax=Polaribacter ponticola TaxID=2978475 RepID=A0ABT5SBE9_9FLAO|nr:serine hydrolase domain-containing protein [Polaribacter sp. MSW5]MDD7915442.1 serine hydrolase [Polaribacter sp. MSW5]
MKYIVQLFLFLIICSVNAQNIDGFISQYAKNGKELGIRSNFNGIILVAKDNEVILNKAYGYADIELKDRLTTKSKFLIGSLTKPFVALLVLQQVEKGTIKLKQPITDFLPYINKEKGMHLTIHSLLANMSGLPHYEGLRDYIKSMKNFSAQKFTPKEYAQLVDKTGLSAIPNSKFQYSSLGYILLGAVLEEVTGLSFTELIEKHIALPLGLKNTGFGNNTFLKNEVVKNYRFRKGTYTENINRDQSNTYTAGGMHSTTSELYLWSQALRANKLLNKSNTKKLFKENLNGYTYGWQRNDTEILRYIPQAQFYGHSGSVNGFASYLFLADDGTTIIVLCNTAPIQPYKLVSDIYRKVHNEDLSKNTRIILPGFKSKALFMKEGGYKGITAYHKRLTKSAGFMVFPSGSYLQRVLRMHLKEKMDLIPLEKIFVRFIKKNQNAEDMLNRVAYEFLKIDKVKALHYFKLNTKLFSESANTWGSLGEFYEKEGSLNKAREAYIKAVAVAKNNFHTDLLSFEDHLKKMNDKIIKE